MNAKDPLLPGLKQVIRRMFHSLDERNFEDFLACFLENGGIIHADGRRTRPSELVRELQRSKPVPPCHRELSGFTAQGAPPLAWLGYQNRVLFGSGQDKDAEIHGLFSETAIFRLQGGAWRIERLHYSGIRRCGRPSHPARKCRYERPWESGRPSPPARKYRIRTPLGCG